MLMLNFTMADLLLVRQMKRFLGGFNILKIHQTSQEVVLQCKF